MFCLYNILHVYLYRDTGGQEYQKKLVLGFFTKAQVHVCYQRSDDLVNLAIYSLPLSLTVNTNFHRGLPLSHSFKYMYIQLSICKQFITSNIFHVHSLYMYLIFLPVFHRYMRRTTAAFLHINVTHILITIKTVL